MIATRYAISWIYGEFRIARMQRGLPVESWSADFHVHDLDSLSKAMSDASENIDLSRGGDVAIAYEDDMHTHDFFEVPNLPKKDLEKLLQRKVISNKPFEEKAAWCYHEAKHDDDEEGILLHLLPQHIVDAIIRICQEFYLTPKRLVPLTEVVSEITPAYQPDPEAVIIAVAMFSERTEIIICKGDGEVLFVRELPYSGYHEGQQRLIIDINRTIQYAKQSFGKPVTGVWLIGEDTDLMREQIDQNVDAEIHLDPSGLEPIFWAVDAAKLPGQLSANFIPLLARKRINKNLFQRVAMWMLPAVAVTSIAITTITEIAIARQTMTENEITTEIASIQQKISNIQTLIKRRDTGKEKLQLLRADAQNLPALFVNHLGRIVPDGLVLSKSEVQLVNEEWKITLQGNSDLSLNETVDILQQLESSLQSNPWNITIAQSWKSSWYQQLKSGAASSKNKIGFEITGWMR